MHADARALEDTRRALLADPTDLALAVRWLMECERMGVTPRAHVVGRATSDRRAKWGETGYRSMIRLTDARGELVLTVSVTDERLGPQGKHPPPWPIEVGKLRRRGGRLYASGSLVCRGMDDGPVRVIRVTTVLGRPIGPFHRLGTHHPRHHLGTWPYPGRHGVMPIEEDAP